MFHFYYNIFSIREFFVSVFVSAGCSAWKTVPFPLEHSVHSQNVCFSFCFRRVFNMKTCSVSTRAFYPFAKVHFCFCNRRLFSMKTCFVFTGTFLQFTNLFPFRFSSSVQHENMFCFSVEHLFNSRHFRFHFCFRPMFSMKTCVVPLGHFIHSRISHFRFCFRRVFSMKNMFRFHYSTLSIHEFLVSAVCSAWKHVLFPLEPKFSFPFLLSPGFVLHSRIQIYNIPFFMKLSPKGSFIFPFISRIPSNTSS